MIKALNYNPYNLRASEGQPNPPSQPPQQPTTNELYEQVDAVLSTVNNSLNTDPTAKDDVQESSRFIKNQFSSFIKQTTTLPTQAEQARGAALMALSAGMMAGGLDALVLLAADQGSQEANPTPPDTASNAPETIGQKIDEMLAKLQEQLAKSKEELKNTGKEALQKSSVAGKKVATAVVNKAPSFVNNKFTPVVAYQAYLAGVFALGYGLGATDAAIISVAGETPQNPAA